MLSHDLTNLRAMFDQCRKGGMRLEPAVVVRICQAIEVMAEQARALEAHCVPAGARLTGDLPQNVVHFHAVPAGRAPHVSRDDPGDPGDAA